MIVVGIGGYVGAVFNNLLGVDVPAPVWWLIFYALFVGLNIVGVEATFKFSVFITFLALGYSVGVLDWRHPPISAGMRR